MIRPVRRRLAAAAVSLLLFAIVAAATQAGALQSLDEHLLLAFQFLDRAPPGTPARWLEIVFRDVTALGGYTVLGLFTFAIFGFLWLNAQRGAALLVLVSAAGGVLISNLLKALFERPRPDLVRHIVEVSSASFPSGHAMLSATVYLTLGAICAQVLAPSRLRLYPLLIGVGFALLVGVSRLVLGVHWPTDVLAGWCVGAAWAFSCSAAAEHLQRRGLVEELEPKEPLH